MPCIKSVTCSGAAARGMPALPRGGRLQARALPKQYQPGTNGVPSAPSKGMRPREDLVWDKNKEVSRTYRRSVYDFDYWANHRSTWRYFFHITSMPASRIIRSLSLPIFWVMGVATIVCANHTLVQQGAISPSLEIPNLDMAPVSLTSFALSLLLVFRTNSSYGRFDEARKFWGLLLNRSRDIVRQAIGFFPARDPSGNSNEHTKATFGRWMSVCTIALKAHLRPGEDLETEAGKYLAKDEMDLLMGAAHKPLLCFQVLTHIIESSGASGFQALQMQENIKTFEDVLGGCERLLRTPLPVSYTRHTSRFLILWLTVVPFALVGKLSWATVPAVGFIALLLLGIEEIGVEIEDPFGILPLEAISGKACADISELLRRQRHTLDISVGNDLKPQRNINETMYNIEDRPRVSA